MKNCEIRLADYLSPQEHLVMYPQRTPEYLVTVFPALRLRGSRAENGFCIRPAAPLQDLASHFARVDIASTHHTDSENRP